MSDIKIYDTVYCISEKKICTVERIIPHRGTKKYKLDIHSRSLVSSVPRTDILTMVEYRKRRIKGLLEE